MHKVKDVNEKIFWMVLILFIAQAITLPLVINFTYSDRYERIDHTITYNTQKLKWDEETKVGANGEVQISLFNDEYKNVESVNGDNIIAPGTENKNIIRLKNDTDREIEYTAVLYELDKNDNLEIEINLNGAGFYDSEIDNLPNAIKKNTIVRCVKGTLKGQRVQDFDINWAWSFSKGQDTDKIDTFLGNKFEDVKVGFHIMVSDNGEIINPQTGDNTFLSIYIALMFLSGLSLTVLLIIRKKKEN